MHPANNASLAKTQSRRLPAAVLAAGEPGADQVARIVPSRAEIVKVGGCIVGYRLTPARAKRRLGLLDLRVREIERFIVHRFGSLRIETDDAALFAELIAAHLDPNWSHGWVRRVCPRLGDAGAEIVAEAARSRVWWSAKALGEVIGLTWDERRLLRIRTIRASDITLAEARRRSRELKREADRLRAEQVRRRAGVAPRVKGDSAAAEAAAAGVDRRTIQRRRKRAAEAACRLKIASTYSENYMRDFRAASAFGAPPTWPIPPWLKAAFARPARIVPANFNTETARIGALVTSYAAAHRVAASIRRVA